MVSARQRTLITAKAQFKAGEISEEEYKAIRRGIVKDRRPGRGAAFAAKMQDPEYLARTGLGERMAKVGDPVTVKEDGKVFTGQVEKISGKKTGVAIRPVTKAEQIRPQVQAQVLADLRASEKRVTDKREQLTSKFQRIATLPAQATALEVGGQPLLYKYDRPPERKVKVDWVWGQRGGAGKVYRSEFDVDVGKLERKYERVEKKASKKVKKVLPEYGSPEYKRYTRFDPFKPVADTTVFKTYVEPVRKGIYGGIREKPVKAAAVGAASFGLGVGIAYLPAGAISLPLKAGLGVSGIKYFGEIVETAREYRIKGIREGRTYAPEFGEYFGEKLSTEIIPATIGYKLGEQAMPFIKSKIAEFKLSKHKNQLASTIKDKSGLPSEDIEIGVKPLKKIRTAEDFTIEQGKMTSKARAQAEYGKTTYFKPEELPDADGYLFKTTKTTTARNLPGGKGTGKDVMLPETIQTTSTRSGVITESQFKDLVGGESKSILKVGDTGSGLYTKSDGKILRDVTGVVDTTASSRRISFAETTFNPFKVETVTATQKPTAYPKLDVYTDVSGIGYQSKLGYTPKLTYTGGSSIVPTKGTEFPLIFTGQVRPTPRPSSTNVFSIFKPKPFTGLGQTQPQMQMQMQVQKPIVIDVRKTIGLTGNRLSTTSKFSNLTVTQPKSGKEYRVASGQVLAPPRTIRKIITEPTTRYRVGSRSKGIELQSPAIDIRQRTGTRITPVYAPVTQPQYRLRTDIITGQRTGIKITPRYDFRMDTRMKTDMRTEYSFRPITPPRPRPYTPPTPRPPTRTPPGFDFDFNKQQKKPKKKKKKKTKSKPFEIITPSVEAGIFNMKFRQPKWKARTGLFARSI